MPRSLSALNAEFQYHFDVLAAWVERLIDRPPPPSWQKTRAYLSDRLDRSAQLAAILGRRRAAAGGYSKVWDIAWENPTEVRRASMATLRGVGFRIAEAFAFGTAAVAMMSTMSVATTGSFPLLAVLGASAKAGGWVLCGVLRKRADDKAKRSWKAVAERTTDRLVKDTVKHHRELWFEQLVAEGDGLGQRLNDDLQLVKRSISERLHGYRSGGALLYGSLAAIAIVAWQMVVPIAVGVILLRRVMQSAAKTNRTLSGTVSAAQSNSTSFIVSALSTHASLRDNALGTVSDTIDKATGLAQTANQEDHKATSVRERANGRVLAIYSVAVAVSMFALRLVSQQYAWAATLLTSRAREGIDRRTDLELDLQDGAEAAARLEAFLNTPPSARGSMQLDPSKPHGIVLEDVHFAYQDGRAVLHGVSLSVAPGESLGIVGPSGSGKSTLAHIVAGRLLPTSGDAFLGGVPTRALTRETLRRGVVTIAQSGLLLPNFSVRDNLVWQPGGMSAAEACTKVGIADVVENAPLGWDTPVGRFSDGQRQRIAATQFLMMSPAPVYVVDEPTSALDPVTQARVMDEVRERAGGATLIVIGHRMVTVKTCTKIVYVKGGRVIEAGTHDELMQLDGEYATAYRADTNGTLGKSAVASSTQPVMHNGSEVAARVLPASTPSVLPVPVVAKTDDDRSSAEWGLGAA